MELTQAIPYRWLRRLLWLVLAFLLFLALAWLAVPVVLKSQIAERASAALGRKVTLDAVEFTPWTMELSVHNLRVASADGASAQFVLPRLYVQVAAASLWHLAPVLDAISLDAPELHLTHLGGGHYDVDDVVQRLLAPENPPAAPSKPVPFALYNLALKGGSVDFTDQAPPHGAPRVHTVRKLEIALPFLSTLDAQREVSVQPRLAFELNGSAFDSALQATPFAPARKGEANVNIRHLDVTPYLPYVPPGLPVQLRSGVLDTALHIAFDQEPRPQLLVSGSVTLSDLHLADAQGAALLELGALQLKLRALRPLEQRVQLDDISVRNPIVHLARTVDGRVQPVLSAPGPGGVAAKRAASADAAHPAQSGAPWEVELAHLGLQGGSVHWNDAKLKPAARLALSDLHLDVHNLRWPLAAVARAATPAAPAASGASAPLAAAHDGAPSEGAVARFEGGVRLHGGATPAAGAQQDAGAQLQFAGQGNDHDGTATLQVQHLALALGAPYLAQYVVPGVQGVADADLAVRWHAGAWQATLHSLAVSDFALLPTPADSSLQARDLPSFAKLELHELQLDPAARSVAVGSVLLQSPAVRVQRDNAGQVSALRWLKAGSNASGSAVPAAAAASSAAPVARASPSAPWRVQLGQVQVDKATLTLVDRVPARPVFLTVSGLSTRLGPLSLDGRQAVPVQLSAQLAAGRNDPGSLAFKGSVAWNPVQVQGTLDAQQLPLQLAASYLGNVLPVDVLHANGSFKGQLRYAAGPAGPDLRLQGDAAVQDLKVNSLAAAPQDGAAESPEEELLSWRSLSLPGVDLAMAPGAALQLALREVNLSDLFARLVVTPQGRLQLQDLVQPVPGAASAANAAGSTAASASGAVGAATAPVPAASAAASLAPAAASAPAPNIRVGALRLTNGHIAFSDRFIQPNYSADLTELNGTLGGFSSKAPGAGAVQMAALQLSGRAQGSASVDISGQVNPLATPLALDIRTRVRDLELSPLSSYAVKYAGYGIERGRLSVDLSYRVDPNGELSATNSIVLNQLTFGEKPARSGSSLPVRLAVALLSDSDGMINLDLPIHGSLNDPQFNIWPVVWKALGNLIAKALVSPFSLFGGGSGHPELSNVSFVAGTDALADTGRAGLDTVARELIARPALRLTVTGSASLEREAQAIRRARLLEMARAELPPSDAAASGAATGTTLSADDPRYPDLLKRAYQHADIRKPRNLIGLHKDLALADMEQLLMASMVVDEDGARQLAQRRALAVRDYLTQRQLAPERVFLGDEKVQALEPDWQPRAELSISHP